MSPFEYSLNFSSEILVAILVVIIAIANVVVFNPFTDSTQQDKSLAAHLLRYHTGLNDQLATKHNTVSTTMSNGGFISQAFADDSEGSVLGATTDIASDELSEDGIEDNGINKANPDSVQKLVSNQVQIYDTVAFDTVYTVAEKFGLTPRTIRESNGLPNNALKAGWKLVIPPVNGLVIKVESDLSLYDISQKYGADLEKVVSYNGLEGPDSEVAIGEYLIVPGGVLPEAPKPAAAPATATTKAAKPSVPKASFTGSNKFVPGQCTDYAARTTGWVNWRGNASAWMTNAKAKGHTVNRVPAVGSIVQTNESRYGHVGVVESVSADGKTFSFGEFNYAGPFKYTKRTMSVSDGRVKGFIHR